MLGKKYLITCNLKTPNWNYSGFYNSIGTLGAWWHYIDSTWIVKNCPLTIEQIYQRIAPHLSQKDFVLVIEVVPSNKNGWLPKDAWDWLDT